jgi:hypothetical protein
LYFDAQFFMQLAYQGTVRSLAGFNFAAGKLPVSGPDFADGTLGEKKRTIRLLQNRCGDFDDFGFLRLITQVRPSICRPDKHIRCASCAPPTQTTGKMKA